MWKVSGIFRIVLSTCVLIVMSSRTARSEPPIDAGGWLLWFSDIHFDPFGGGQVSKLANASQTGWRDHSEWGAILKRIPANRSCSPAGRDANDGLLQMVLRRAAAPSQPRPNAILITGDFLAHDFSATYFNTQQLPARLATVTQYNRFVDQTLAYVALSVSQKFPGVPVIAALGNNDAYCGDYGIRSDSGFLSTTRRTFQKYFLPDLPEDFVTYGGCYATLVPGTRHKFVVLNSVPCLAGYPESWSLAGLKKLTTACGRLRSVELVDEMDWLARTMDDCAEDQRVWIVCHIPPGVSCYDGTQNWSRPVPDQGERVPFVNVFSDFYLKRQNQFAGILAGHSHNAEFKLIRGGRRDEASSFVLMAPSIGRNHGNNASFRCVRFNRSNLRIEDYTTHWLDGSTAPPTWATPFTFRETYGQSDVSAASLSRVFKAMQSRATLPSGKTVLDQYFYDYSTRTGAANRRPRTHYSRALDSIIGP